LLAALRGEGHQPDQVSPTTVRVRGISAAEVGHLAFTAGVELHELRAEKFDLEELFFSLTQGEYAAPQAGAPWSP
jgi:ABC-2 type transport system ATP-binding protein